jgi:hypothetical protein
MSFLKLNILSIVTHETELMSRSIVSSAFVPTFYGCTGLELKKTSKQ